jgi:starch-binding outer membrane protein, SusD/RagB family
MKNIFILLICTIAGLTGCKKFLEEQPYSFIAPENFYKTGTDAELALTGVYDVLNAANIQGQGNSVMWARGMQWMTTFGCDEIMADPLPMNDNNFVTIANYTYTAENTQVIYTYFSLFAGISRANYIIERVPAIQMDATRKEQIIAEARMLKGVYNFYLGMLYGGVPLVNETQPDLTAPRATLETIMKQAESDFRFAYEKLPVRNTKPGRVNKYSAAGFLVKLYTYLASCKENNVGSSLGFALNSFDWVNAAQLYNQALTICQDIYSNSNYKLLRPYTQLFLSATEAAARDEHMFIVQAGGGVTTEAIGYAYFPGPKNSYNTLGGSFGWSRPVRELYARYNVADPRRAMFTGYMNANSIPPVTINGIKYYQPDPLNSTLSNISLNKWPQDDPVARVTRGVAAYNGETDFGVLRYADILLMFAECKFKTGDEPGARALLREVRLRAAADNATTLNTMTTAYLKTNFMDELMEERSRELCAEGWRRFDLIRTGRLKAVVQALNTTPLWNQQPVSVVVNNYSDNKIWYPIPRREIETNRNLIQNPGY